MHLLYILPAILPIAIVVADRSNRPALVIYGNLDREILDLSTTMAYPIGDDFASGYYAFALGAVAISSANSTAIHFIGVDGYSRLIDGCTRHQCCPNDTQPTTQPDFNRPGSDSVGIGDLPVATAG